MNTHNRKVLFSSADQTWRTPTAVYTELNKEFAFDFDPCPPNPTFDGLTVDWGKRSFVNPPYRTASVWIRKAWAEAEKGKLVVLLIAARTDTKAFHEVILPHADEIRFVKGRLKFNDFKNSAPFPSMIVVFRGGLSV